MKFNPPLMLAIGFAFASGAVHAQSYPTRPITLIVPFAPGASADGVARLVGKKMSASMGKPVVVENRPGAGGATGLLAVANAAPDGYTIALGATGAVVIGPHLPDAAKLDPQKQLAPLAKLADIPLVMVAGASTGMKTLQDVLGKARSDRQGVAYGTSGQYTSHHLSGELLALATRANLIAISYRGSASAVTDVVGGQVPVAIVDLTSAAPHFKSGRMHAVAVTSPTRSKLLPDVPTVAEAGVPGYAALGWLGMFAPAKTPAPIVERLAEELRKATADPEVQRQVLAISAEPAYLGPREFAAFIAAESTKWAGVVAAMPKQK